MSTDQLKFRAGQAFRSIFSEKGYPIYLGGGAGVATWGGSRPVKDLDFKMGRGLKEKWKKEIDRDKIIQHLVDRLPDLGYRILEDNRQAKRQLPYVLRLKIVDRLSDFRAKGMNAKLGKQVKDEISIEISLTSAGVYDEKTLWEREVGPALFANPVDLTQLALDKVFVFAQRELTQADKIRTDFEDLAQLLDLHQSRIEAELLDMEKESEIITVRNSGYKNAVTRRNDWMDSVVNQALIRIKIIKPDLEKPPAWNEFQDEELRRVEVKFMIGRVERFLGVLSACPAMIASS